MIDYFSIPSKTLLSKIRTIALGFLITLVWVTIISNFLDWLHKAPSSFLVGLGGQMYPYKPPIMVTFFFMCIVAPLWEELVFRVGVIQLAKSAGERFVLPMVILSSALFGWAHGNGPISILFQGVMGAIFAGVYIKNGYSYWSVVILHFLWNFFYLVYIMK